MSRVGPATARLIVRTFREGPAAPAGHDLVLEVTRWEASPALNGPQPRLTLTADAQSLEIREATGGVKPLSDRDRDEIRRRIGDALDAARHPEITFVSTAVEPAGPDTLSVSGDVTIAGVTRPARFDLVRDGATLRATVPISQAAFGIRPPRALLGALRVADVVEVSVRSPRAP